MTLKTTVIFSKINNSVFPKFFKLILSYYSPHEHTIIREENLSLFQLVLAEILIFSL
jgi:hypothetical protein